MSNWIIYTIGFIAQILFSSRLVVQWITSEKHRKVITPTLFWTLSLIASFLLFIYGYLRNDFAIMLGQSLTYFIYIRNLQLQNEWQKFPKLIRWFLFLTPTLIIIYYFNNNRIDVELLFKNESIPFWLLSLTGSLLILTYALFRRDPVLFTGHILGSIIYVRNLILLYKYDD